MEIDEILDKWFDETFAMYQEKVHPPREVDLLMMGVLRYSRHCSITIFLLLRQEVKLSVMALLRVYLELYAKLCWCLKNDPNNQKDHKDEVYDKFKRWDYKRLVERRSVLNNLLEVTRDGSNSEICQAIEKANDCIERQFQSEAQHLWKAKWLVLSQNREKNRLGRQANWGNRGAIWLSGAPNDFSR